MIRLLTAALMLGLFSIAVPARAQTDPLVAELIESLAAAVEAIEADPAEVAALEAEAAALEAEIAARQASLAEVRVRLASLEDGRAARLAEAQRLWRQLGTYLMADPGPAPEPEPQAPLTAFPAQPVAYQNYNQVYHPIEGAQPGKMADGTAFAFNALVPQPDGSLIHRLTDTQGAAIKWEAEKALRKTQGLYMTEATFSEVWPGVVYNPLWLYSEGSSEGGHEFDFEYMSGRLEYNLHNGSGGFRMKTVNKDLAGHRVRWSIERRPGRVVMTVLSLTDGWTDSLTITPTQVAIWSVQPGAPANLRFPPDSVAMFPVTELWRCRWPDWCGTYQPLPAGKTIDMTLHGYHFTP